MMLEMRGWGKSTPLASPIFALFAAAVILTVCFAGVAPGQTTEPAKEAPSTAAPKEDYSGDFFSRSTLTGDWAGLRSQLAGKGVKLDLTWTNVMQGIVNGGKDASWEYGGRADLTLNLDTGKLGLWPGGFFTLEVEGNYEDSVNGYPGALMPVNSTMLYPTPSEGNLNIPAVNFTQFVSEYLGFTLGKFDTMSGDANAFAHGKGDAQFMNLALNVNPTLLMSCPYSTLGGGVIVLPTRDPEAAIVSFMVLSATGEASTSGLGDLRSDNLTFNGEARIRTNFLHMTGHQLVGAAYSNKTFTSLNQRLSIESRGVETKTDTWAFYYNFDQYLYQPVKNVDKGIGIFGRFGVADGDSNPMEYFYSAGIGGKGVLPTRGNDSFGIGAYYIDVSQPTFTGPLMTRKFLGDEKGLEAYYNIALTKWCILTPDIQYIVPSQQETIAGENVKDSTILGFRLQVIF